MSTAIEWTDETWNPVTGCTKVSQGCKNCYAERVAERWWKGRAFTDVRCHPERLEQPLRWKKPRRVFVNSMSDLFHEHVPSEFIAAVFGVMAACQQHTFQILTKRPRRMLDWFEKQGMDPLWEWAGEADEAMKPDWRLAPRIYGHFDDETGESDLDDPLPNVWLGVSVEDQATADERIPLLLKTPAAVRFVSYEPALGPVDFEKALHHVPPCDACFPSRNSLDWIIAGGESGPGARPAHPDWFRCARDQCAAAGVPFFFKQWGEWLHEDVAYDRDLKCIEAGPPPGGFYRIGRRASGRELDECTHDAFPGLPHA